MPGLIQTKYSAVAPLPERAAELSNFLRKKRRRKRDRREWNGEERRGEEKRGRKEEMNCRL